MCADDIARTKADTEAQDKINEKQRKREDKLQDLRRQIASAMDTGAHTFEVVCNRLGRAKGRFYNEMREAVSLSVVEVNTPRGKVSLRRDLSNKGEFIVIEKFT